MSLLSVLPPSAVASVGPNGVNRYHKCDDPKNVTLSDNPGHPGLHQPVIDYTAQRVAVE